MQTEMDVALMKYARVLRVRDEAFKQARAEYREAIERRVEELTKTEVDEFLRALRSARFGRTNREVRERVFGNNPVAWAKWSKLAGIPNDPPGRKRGDK